jgi:hypothetical protein
MSERVKKRPSPERAHEPLPVLILVVDQDLTIQELNGPARELLGPACQAALGKRSGEVFLCAHSQEAATGCGRGRFCQLCSIREAATLAGKEQRVVRRRTTAELGAPGQTREVHLLVTATPLPSRRSGRTLLVFEDISALMELQTPAPICAHCRRILEDDHYWQEMEAHFKQHLDLDLSHGVCPECKQQFFGNLLDNAGRPR